MDFGNKLCITDTFKHGVIEKDLFNEMIKNIDKIYVKYVITHNIEIVSYIRDEFKDSVIIFLPLTHADLHICDKEEKKENIDFVIFNMELYESDKDKYFQYINNELVKMNIIFKNALYISNPPYGKNRNQIYPKFYIWAKNTFGKVRMIFPSKWQEPTEGSGLSLMNTKEIKEDKQIVYIDNKKDVFKGVPGASNINIIYWESGYNNGLDGNQKILTNGENPKITKLIMSIEGCCKPKELIDCVNIIKSNDKYHFESMYDYVSARRPYDIDTDFLQYPTKYGYPEIDMTNVVYLGDKGYRNVNDDKIHIYGRYDDNSDRNDKKCFISIDDNYEIKTFSKSAYKYKVFIGKSWGNMDDKYYGGSYTYIVLASPKDICTDVYLESGCFDTLFKAKCHAKYIMSKFVRFLLMDNKTGSSNSRGCWKSVPKQSYVEDWWSSEDINDIDEHLFEKYELPDSIREYIRKNVQEKSLDDIKNYKDTYDIDCKEVEHIKYNKQTFDDEESLF